MPDISKITLPSGTTYDIKDSVAREAIAGGVSFIIAWDGASTPVVANIPAGVQVVYSGTTYTGTLAVGDAVTGAFYLVKSSTTPSSQTLDIYDEYTVIKPTSTTTDWFWEKIGDTNVNLSDVVTGVTLNKQTDSVIGADATFTITQPTIALATDTTSGTGKVEVVTGISGASASGDSVTAVTGYANTSSDTFLKGVQVTAQPTVTLTANTATASGRITYVQAQGSATTTKLGATASGAAADWNSKDSKTVVTGYASPSSDTFVKTVSSTSKKLVTTSVTGVSGSTTASKAAAGTSQTTATGAGTASSTNTDWLKGVSVSNETLVIGAATMNTQTTTQYTFSDVTVPTAAASSTRVATGAVADSDSSGATVVTAASAGTTGSGLTGLGTASTATVIGSSATISVTDPTVTLASGDTGDVTVATGIGAATTRYLSASASGTTVGADGTGSALTALGTPSTDTVLGTGSTITVTPTTTNIKATASGANTAWNNKDTVTALTNATTITVTKGE